MKLFWMPMDGLFIFKLRQKIALMAWLCYDLNSGLAVRVNKYQTYLF